MKSWRFHEFGHIRNLRLEEIDVPRPAEGEALVKIAYAGLNPADKFLIMGLYQGAGIPPFAVGRDGCGTIVIPAQNGRFPAGQKVVFLRGQVGITREGTLAEYVTVSEAHLGALPDWWSMIDAAGGSLVLLTAWQALTQAKVTSTDRLLVNGASGGVGVASLTLGKALGLQTIALSRNPA